MLRSIAQVESAFNLLEVIPVGALNALLAGAEGHFLERQSKALIIGFALGSII